MFAVIDFVSTEQFDTAGDHEVFVSAYYDANEDGQNNPNESVQFKTCNDSST